jgi:protocatechuate 3,4-dioxygenase alpha subunit
VPAACCPARPTRTEGDARRDSGVYAFETIKPGAVEGRNGRVMAPHINAWIVARGINIGLNTRIYFSDEAEANGNDAVLSLIEWEQRRKTLVAERQAKKSKDGAAVYRFDIRLQGEDETVFFDV